MADINKNLFPSNAFSSAGPAVHEIDADKESIIYVQTDGKYDIQNF